MKMPPPPPPSFPALEDFTAYLLGIKGRSPLTVKEYRYDLVLFFRHYLQENHLVDPELPFDAIPLDGVDLPLIASIQLTDLYRFISWLNRTKQASPATRSRKVASLRSFFQFLHKRLHVIPQNPAADLESPRPLRRQPRYLEVYESRAMLEAASHQQNATLSARDYCILTLFLNCGLRLAELCALNCHDVGEESLRVLGKGGKERTVVLNGACTQALLAYLECRPEPKPKDKDALFISRQGNRIAHPTVQRLVKEYLRRAGLDSRRYSTHKLRHTAATLLYKYGQVDIRLLQQLLGHASVSTTEIYTHLDRQDLHAAIEKNPLATERAVPREKRSDAGDS